MTPKILFENDDFIVVSKPSGMVTNRADTAKGQITLQDWVEKEFKIQNSELRIEDKEKYMVGGYNKFEEFINRSGIVHRLDKETSGIILVAKNPETFIALQNQFKNGEVEKTYIALVHGKTPSEGEIDKPIGRLPWNRKRFGVLEEGRPARTLYKTLDYKKNQLNKTEEVLSLVEVYPKTGRTHQIRVHFQSIHHPIFGDELYAGRKTGRDDRREVSTHFLHAQKISLLDPKTNKRINFENPLPADLLSYLQSLQSVWK